MLFAPAQHSCHHDGSVAPGHDSSHNRNACLMHCMQADQNLDSQPQGPVAQVAAAQVALLSVPSVVTWPPQLQTPVVTALNHSPPIPILHCRFLI